jgi:hypothetical protein
VTQDLLGERISGAVTLGAPPDPSTSSDLRIGFGYAADGVCESDVEVVTPTTGTLSPGFTASGATIGFAVPNDRADTALWDCAFVALTPTGAPPNPANAYDALVGPLTDVAGQPALRISEVELLRSMRERSS